MRTRIDIGYLALHHQSWWIRNVGAVRWQEKSRKKKQDRNQEGTIITPSRDGYQWIQIGSNAYIRGAVFLVSAYAKPVSRGWCSQSPGLWIMHAIFARSKRNVRSRALACIYICIICTRERMYIDAIRIYAFWRVRRWNRTVIRMIYTRWTVGFETRRSTARVLLREASWRWIRLVVHVVVYLRRWKRDTLRESRVNCHINSRRDFLLDNCCVTFDNTFR